MQRSDFGKLRVDGFHQCLDGLGIVLSDGHKHHHLAGRGYAYHECAQEAVVGAYVIKLQIVLLAVILYKCAYAVAEIVLKMACINVEHLVKSARYVKSGCAAVGKLHA